MRKSKARIVVELLGEKEMVRYAVQCVIDQIREAEAKGIQASYPAPCMIEDITRNRKKAAPKPERKARKANSQQPEAAPTEANLSA